MAKIPNTHGGGATTTINGLAFERKTSLDDALATQGYMVTDYKVYNSSKQEIGMSVPKYKLYKEFLEPNGIKYLEINSKRWLPDECFVNFQNNTAYIIEKKYQQGAGSVDEKLPGCDFKRKEYEKLFMPLGYQVEYLYVFNDWFKDVRYKDTLEYIQSVGCSYYYDILPLEVLGL